LSGPRRSWDTPASTKLRSFAASSRALRLRRWSRLIAARLSATASRASVIAATSGTERASTTRATPRSSPSPSRSILRAAASSSRVAWRPILRPTSAPRDPSASATSTAHTGDGAPGAPASACGNCTPGVMRTPPAASTLASGSERSSASLATRGTPRAREYTLAECSPWSLQTSVAWAPTINAAKSAATPVGTATASDARSPRLSAGDGAPSAPPEGSTSTTGRSARRAAGYTTNDASTSAAAPASAALCTLAKGTPPRGAQPAASTAHAAHRSHAAASLGAP
jgi:hypothetical protein